MQRNFPISRNVCERSVTVSQTRFSCSADRESDACAEFAEKLRGRLEQTTSALYSSSRLWDDGIILPQHTRQVRALAV